MVQRASVLSLLDHGSTHSGAGRALTGASRLTQKPVVPRQDSNLVLPCTGDFATHPHRADFQRLKYHFSILCACVFVAGCTSVPVAVCPAIVEYSPGQQAEAADELLALPAGSILTQYMIDYGVLRAKLRACQ